MFYEQDYDEERLRAETILFWGMVGPQTGIAVVLADGPHDLIDWMRERSRVEGRSSWLSRALVSVEKAAREAGADIEVAADAIGSALEEAGVPFFACGPLRREIVENDLVRSRIGEDRTPPSEGAEGSEEAGVWRGGEKHADVEGSPMSPTEGDDDEPAKGYRLDDEIEELAEHVDLDFARADHREFLIERLERLKTPPPNRQAA